VVNKWKTLPGAVAIAVAVTVGATTTVKGLKGRQEKTRKMVKGKRAEKEPKHRSSLETFPRTAEKLRGNRRGNPLCGVICNYVARPCMPV